MKHHETRHSIAVLAVADSIVAQRPVSWPASLRENSRQHQPELATASESWLTRTRTRVTAERTLPDGTKETILGHVYHDASEPILGTKQTILYYYWGCPRRVLGTVTTIHNATIGGHNDP